MQGTSNDALSYRRPMRVGPASEASREHESARGPAVRIPNCEIRATDRPCPWRKARTYRATACDTPS